MSGKITRHLISSSGPGARELRETNSAAPVGLLKEVDPARVKMQEVNGDEIIVKVDDSLTTDIKIVIVVIITFCTKGWQWRSKGGACVCEKRTTNNQ